MKKPWLIFVWIAAALGAVAPLAARSAEPAENDRLGYFIRAGVGLDLFLKPALTDRREFALYSETGAVDETYTVKNGSAFEGLVGRYIRFRRSRMKVGAGFASWKLPAEGAFTVTLPHPFLANTPRTAGFSETAGLNKSAMSFYGFALFPLLDSEKISVFLGPILGYASSTFVTLDDFDLTERSPFTSADVTVSNPAYFEETISELLYGVSLSLELNLDRSLALILDTKLNYFNPKVTNLGKRVNLLHLQPTLGIQFSF